MMHGREKSSPVIVAGKPANKAQPETVTVAESVERRTGAKGNANQPATIRTQSRAHVAASGLALALASIRQAALPDRLYPRWEPYAGKPHVRVCAGGARQLASLPRRAPGQSWCDPAGASPAQVRSSVRLVASVAQVHRRRWLRSVHSDCMGCGIEPRKVRHCRGRGFSFARRQHVRHRHARGAVALPGSKATSRAKGSYRNLGGLVSGRRCVARTAVRIGKVRSRSR
jgi:hypothetical protein